MENTIFSAITVFPDKTYKTSIHRGFSTKQIPGYHQKPTTSGRSAGTASPRPGETFPTLVASLVGAWAATHGETGVTDKVRSPMTTEVVENRHGSWDVPMRNDEKNL